MFDVSGKEVERLFMNTLHANKESEYALWEINQLAKDLITAHKEIERLQGLVESAKKFVEYESMLSNSKATKEMALEWLKDAKGVGE